MSSSRASVRPPDPHPSGARPPALPAEVVPKHVAVIMDGNGRWAEQRGLPRSMGHRAGVEAVRLAMRETYEAQAHESFNPSAEWTQRTGLPFVFAPWIVREGVDVLRGRIAVTGLYQRGEVEQGRREL